MGEEVPQSDVASTTKNSAGIDESDKMKISGKDSIEKCEDSGDGSVNDQQPQQAEKSPKKATVKPQDKKWYNISFMHRTSHRSCSNNITTDVQHSVKDNRHSWHLNESVEM